MWVNETIFSEGDLMDREEYDKFISDEYQGNFYERLEHVKSMLKRLQAEEKMLEENDNEIL